MYLHAHDEEHSSLQAADSLDAIYWIFPFAFKLNLILLLSKENACFDFIIFYISLLIFLCKHSLLYAIIAFG